MEEYLPVRWLAHNIKYGWLVPTHPSPVIPMFQILPLENIPYRLLQSPVKTSLVWEIISRLIVCLLQDTLSLGGRCHWVLTSFLLLTRFHIMNMKGHQKPLPWTLVPLQIMKYRYGGM